MRLIYWLIVLSLIIVAVTVAVANRGTVELSLDPFSQTDPAFTVVLPLFLVMFGCVLIGLVLGGLSMWWSQGSWRKRARVEARRARALERDLERSDKTAGKDGSLAA